MTPPESQQPPIPFSITPRQRRLRSFMTVLLLLVLAMVIAGQLHPFFHHTHAAVLTPTIIKANKARLMLIATYWSAAFFLLFITVLLAFMDIRETRRKTQIAQRDMWKEIAERSRERRGKTSDQ